MQRFGVDSKYILNVNFINRFMLNAIRYMSMVNLVSMTVNYCELMIMGIHLDLSHPYIVNGSH